MAKKNEPDKSAVKASEAQKKLALSASSDVSQDQEAQIPEPSEADLSTFMDTARRLEQSLSSIVVGQERVIRELLYALFAGGHVLLEGVPGLGKTLLVRTLADALKLKFARIQFTPDLMPADIVGTTIVTEQADSTTGA